VQVAAREWYGSGKPEKLRTKEIKLMSSREQRVGTAAAGGGRRAFRGRLIDEPAVTLLNTGGRAAEALAEQRV